MLKPEELANELKTLAGELRGIKPEGWSVVLGSYEIIVRPKDRTSGKFSIRPSQDGVWYAAFFSRELNIWNKSQYFNSSVSPAPSMKDWMESAAADPLKRDNADWREFLTE